MKFNIVISIKIKLNNHLVDEYNILFMDVLIIRKNVSLRNIFYVLIPINSCKTKMLQQKNKIAKIYLLEGYILSNRYFKNYIKYYLNSKLSIFYIINKK